MYNWSLLDSRWLAIVTRPSREKTVQLQGLARIVIVLYSKFRYQANKATDGSERTGWPVPLLVPCNKIMISRDDARAV